MTRAIWVVLIACVLVDPSITITTAVLFTLLIGRLALAAVTSPARRLPLLLLGLSAAVWAVGVVASDGARVQTPADFLGSSEWIFAIAYVGLIGFLITDPDNKRAGPHRAWTDVAVLCGAAWCLAALLLVLGVRHASGAAGTSLLTTLAYPFADLLLGLIVFSQLLLRIRTDRRQTLILAGAIACLGVADTVLALDLWGSDPGVGRLTELLWSLAWVLLVTTACRPARTGMTAVPQSAHPRLLIGAGAVAVAVLAAPIDGTLRWYVVPPAVVTLVAVGGRMAFALRDATQVSQAVELAQTDDLTALPNRRAMHARLARALQSQRPFALMLLDLNGFKEINDALGHHAGDTVLRFAAKRMQATAGEDAVVARLGGDEFALLLEVEDDAALIRTAHRLLAALAEPVGIDGINVTPSGSIGIAVAPGDASISGRHEMLRRADVAMYQAKTSQSGAAVYDARIDDFSRARLQLTEDLRQAVTDGQLEVWYQPQLDVRSGQVRAAEALVRWRHPDHGIIDPRNFLPSARRIGLMGQVTAEVTGQAIRDLDHFLRDGLDLLFAINCAPHELISATFLPTLIAALTAAEIPAQRLVLEITEESFLTDPDRAAELLADIRERGIEISIDDFGTGFSSLGHLRHLPVSELKIDRSLVREVGFDERSLTIVSSTIQMAHSLGLRAVAEGVESEADVRLLTDLGIDSVQGYVIGGPMPAATFAEWLRRRSTE